MTLAAFDSKSELTRALVGSSILKQEVVGGFHNRIASRPDGKEVPFPRVIYQELRNDDDDFQDNKSTSANVGYQISIYTDHATVSKETVIAKEADQIMKSIGYSRYDSVDLYEEDAKVYHKAMRYEKKIL